jgi:hypothetical protein
MTAICPPQLSTNIYLGGDNDGFTFNFIQQCDPLPIELLAFTAACERTRVVLKWTTATELGNDFFTLYRSADGAEFEVVGTVPGAGTSNRVRHYTFTDEQPRPGISYYRLRQTDFDGKFEDAQVLAVTCSGPEADVLVYPNPATDEVTLEAEFHGGSMHVQVINSAGIVVYKGIVSQKATLPIAHLAPGLYLVKIERTVPGAGSSLPILKKLIKR